jgi:hypothetical protein
LRAAAAGSADRGQPAGGEQLLHRLHRQVRVDRAGAVADQQRGVVHLAAVAGLHHQADLGAQPLPDQVVVHAAVSSSDGIGACAARCPGR